MTEREKELLRKLQAKARKEQRDKKKLKEFKKLYPDEFKTEEDEDGKRIRQLAKKYYNDNVKKLFDEVEESLKRKFSTTNNVQ